MIIENTTKKRFFGIFGLSIALLFQTAQAKTDTYCERFDNERSLLIERYYEKAPQDLIAIMLVKLKLDNSNRYKGTKRYVKSLKGELAVIKATNADFLNLNAMQTLALEKNIELLENEIRCYGKKQ